MPISGIPLIRSVTDKQGSHIIQENKFHDLPRFDDLASPECMRCNLASGAFTYIIHVINDKNKMFLSMKFLLMSPIYHLKNDNDNKPHFVCPFFEFKTLPPSDFPYDFP